MQERKAIAEALTEFAKRPRKPADEYNFYGVIRKQTTTGTGSLLLDVLVPWEHRHEVFRALEEMPFECMIRLTGVESD